MRFMECEKCGWSQPDTDLADAVMGFTDCGECEHRRNLDENERREIAWSIENKLEQILPTVS